MNWKDIHGSDRFSGMKESKKIEMGIWACVIIHYFFVFSKTFLKLFKDLRQKEKIYLRENFYEIAIHLTSMDIILYKVSYHAYRCSHFVQ